MTRLSDLTRADARTSARRILATLAVAMLITGAAYTGYHNYTLFARVTDPDWVALIPVVLLEGSLLLLVAGQSYWFAGHTQRTISAVSSWAIFALLALHTVIDSRLAAGDPLTGLLQTYANTALYATPVAIVAAWKLILDADPSHRAMISEHLARAAVEEAQRQAMLSALDDDAITAAIATRRALAADTLARAIAGPDQDRRNGKHPPTLTLHADAPRPKASKATNGAGAAPDGHSGA